MNTDVFEDTLMKEVRTTEDDEGEEHEIDNNCYKVTNGEGNQSTNNYCVLIPRLPTELLDYLNLLLSSSNTPEDEESLVITFDKERNSASITTIDGRNYEFQCLSEERHECYEENQSGRTWRRIGQINDKMLQEKQNLSEADISKFHDSVVQAEQAGKKHKTNLEDQKPKPFKG